MILGLYELAKLIPAKYRKKILEENLVYKAIPSGADPHMMVLFVIWTTYIDTSGQLKADCSYCLTNILTDYKELQPYMVQLQKESSLLDEL